MLGVEDIAFINSSLVFSLMHLFLTETDLDSVVKGGQYIKECVNDCVWVHAHAESGQNCLKKSYNLFCSFDFCIIYVNIKIPCNSKTVKL